MAVAGLTLVAGNSAAAEAEDVAGVAKVLAALLSSYVAEVLVGVELLAV